MRHRLPSALLALGLLVAAAGCYYDVEDELYPPPVGGGPVDGCDTAAVSFAADVLPVFERHCTSCHAGANATAGVRLDSFREVRPWIDGGLLRCTVTHVGSCATMPPGGQLIPDCDVAAVTAWLDAGAPDN